MMEFTDTHCHIHFSDYRLDGDAVMDAAAKEGVSRLVCVGCTVEDSRRAVEFVQTRPTSWASIGIHPHEAKEYVDRPDMLEAFNRLVDKPKVVAIGECGLDYFYNHSPREQQFKVLEYQLELARQRNLPVIFHVREAFADFWPIYERYSVRGVIHSFTDSRKNLEKALRHGLYIGVNGIATFAKEPRQIDVYKAIPLNALLLETDAPFLTPTPYRGKINEPKYVRVTAAFLAALRDESLAKLAQATTINAQKLFGLK